MVKTSGKCQYLSDDFVVLGFHSVAVLWFGL